MPNDFRPFGVRDTDLRSGRFNVARLKLTCMYVLIAFVMLFFSSGIIYSAFAGQLQHRFQGFPTNRGILIVGNLPPRSEDVLGDLTNSLVLVDCAFLLLAAIVSYWLAGETLRPIEIAFERKRRFLSDASHELRTPLAILKTDFENTLHHPELTAELRKRTQSNIEEVDRMTRIVSDLLTLSRVDEDLPIAPAALVALPLTEIVSKTCTRLQSIAEEHRVSLSCGSSDPMLQALGEEESLIHALTNVIRNGILYNRAGGSVTVSTRTEGSQVVVDIVDTGIGIADKDLKHIFDRFYRVDLSRSRATGGSGLGLAIVQSVMHQLGGKVEIQSEIGKGTTISLFLPRATTS